MIKKNDKSKTNVSKLLVQFKDNRLDAKVDERECLLFFFRRDSKFLSSAWQISVRNPSSLVHNAKLLSVFFLFFFYLSLLHFVTARS